MVPVAHQICKAPCLVTMEALPEEKKPVVLRHRGGASASANPHSLVDTAKANGIDTYPYPVALFNALPLAACVDDDGALQPWNLKTLIPARLILAALARDVFESALAMSC